MLDIIITLILLAVLIVPPTLIVVMLVRAWGRHRVLQTGLRGVARVKALDYRYRSFLSGRTVYRLSLSVVPENGAPPFAARVLWGEPRGSGVFNTYQPLLVRYRDSAKPLVVLDEPGMAEAALLSPERHPVLRIVARVAFVIFVVLAVGSLAVMGIVTSVSKASGQIEAEGARLGTWTLEARRCSNGVHDGFFGVVVANQDHDLRISLLRSPEGEPSVLAPMPGTNRALRFSRQNCTELDADIHEGGTVVNGVRGLKGWLTLSCAIDGSTLKGHVDFDKCT
jgi:hypothetical protein